MIGVLIFPNFQLLDAAGPISVFEIAARCSGAPPAIKVMAATPGPLRSSSGVEMLARKFGQASAITTLIIAGGDGVEAAARDKCTIRFVQAVAKRGVRVASVCSGTFVLAEAGLLDGRRATTHWVRTKQFLATYPDVKLEPDRIFVRDGNVWSSAGITAGIDLALAMVAEDYGDEIVEKTARQLVLYHRRSGGQSQFSSLLELKAPTGRFGTLLTWAREHLKAPLTVEDLADRAGMSARHSPAPSLRKPAPRPRRRSSGCAPRWRASACSRRRKRSNASPRPPASVIRSGCAAPSSAPSASRRNRCAARRGEVSVDSIASTTSSHASGRLVGRSGSALPLAVLTHSYGERVGVRGSIRGLSSWRVPHPKFATRKFRPLPASGASWSKRRIPIQSKVILL
jgi:transcriptional regulator GlxA family with amidase domain